LSDQVLYLFNSLITGALKTSSSPAVVGSRVLFFQGSDPATDLRGVGFLGLVQVLYLVMTPELVPFARDVYALSRKEDQVNSKYEFCT
jgi:hypothetical protein